ncbi:hypothetical protein GYB61_09865 [bacterium]|nr:hypothetical protein [bacterium]
MRRSTLAAALIGLATCTSATAGGVGERSPEAMMYMQLGFGGGQAQSLPLVQKLRYGFQFDVAHGYETDARPELLRMEFTGNQFAPLGLGALEVGGVNILRTHYRLNAGGTFSGYSVIDYGLLAVGLAGVGILGADALDGDETPRPAAETGGGDDGGDDGGLPDGVPEIPGVPELPGLPLPIPIPGLPGG